MLLLIQGCKRGDRESQRLLYQHYYGYALSICCRYCHHNEVAVEVVNDGFMKIFQRIGQFNPESSFKAWMRRIMINASIDHYRKERKHLFHASIENVDVPIFNHIGTDELMYEELIRLIQQLSPAYRTVFNMYVIDGYSHEEISQMLKISTGTSKSNLSKARENLKRMLVKVNREEYAKYI
jgi:RNA polymerase sigma-70 factor (ECF subfamily)